MAQMHVAADALHTLRPHPMCQVSRQLLHGQASVHGTNAQLLQPTQLQPCRQLLSSYDAAASLVCPSRCTSRRLHPAVVLSNKGSPSDNPWQHQPRCLGPTFPQTQQLSLLQATTHTTPAGLHHTRNANWMTLEPNAILWGGQTSHRG